MYQTYPIYIPSVRYAKENNELALWRESYKINQECRDYINSESSMAYHERRLPEFIKELTGTFGLERSMFVIARFIAAADWDGRYYSEVKNRAAQFDFQDMKEGKALYEAGKDPHRTADHTIHLYSNVHPCILNDIFRSLMKMEQDQTDLRQADNLRDNALDEGAEI